MRTNGTFPAKLAQSIALIGSSLSDVSRGYYNYSGKTLSRMRKGPDSHPEAQLN